MLSDVLPQDALRRGRELVSKKSVMLSSSSDTLVRASVKDARVTLQSEGVETEQCSATCTCTPGRKGQVCKHIAAAVLAAEDKGLDFVSNKTDVTVNAAEIKAKFKPERKFEPRKFEPRGKEKKERPPAFEYPADIEEARTYFRANGFELEHPLEIDALISAKKLLMRVFHPDKGGSHEETVTLNAHFETIRAYLQS